MKLSEILSSRTQMKILSGIIRSLSSAISQLIRQNFSSYSFVNYDDEDTHDIIRQFFIAIKTTIDMYRLAETSYKDMFSILRFIFFSVKLLRKSKISDQSIAMCLVTFNRLTSFLFSINDSCDTIEDLDNLIDVFESINKIRIVRQIDDIRQKAFDIEKLMIMDLLSILMSREYSSDRIQKMNDESILSNFMESGIDNGYTVLIEDYFLLCEESLESESKIYIKNLYTLVVNSRTDEDWQDILDYIKISIYDHSSTLNLSFLLRSVLRIDYTSQTISGTMKTLLVENALEIDG